MIIIHASSPSENGNEPEVQLINSSLVFPAKRLEALRGKFVHSKLRTRMAAILSAMPRIKDFYAPTRQGRDNNFPWFGSDVALTRLEPRDTERQAQLTVDRSAASPTIDIFDRPQFPIAWLSV